MSVMVSFMLSLFRRDVLDESLNIIESVSEGFPTYSFIFHSSGFVGWLGGAMVLGKLPVPGRPTILIRVGQGSTALTVGAGGGCLDIFTLIYPFSPLSPYPCGAVRYRLKYCLKVPLNPKQPTNQKLRVYLAGWLFWAQWPFQTVFQSISGRLPERGRKKREMIDERKKSKHPHLL